MAGYVGTRPSGGIFSPRRTAPLPGGRPAPNVDRPGRQRGRAVDLPRRSVRGVTAVRAQRRQARVGYVMIAIVVAFLLGLFSLSQTIRVSAMDYDLDGLVIARQQLDATSRDLRADLARLGGEPAVRRQAFDAGLAPMVEPVVVPVR
jgi:hypothetical protein